MNLGTEIAKAEHVSSREGRLHYAALLKSRKVKVLTDRHQPSQVVIPYCEAVALAEIIDELNNPEIVRQVEEGRRGYQSGKDVPITATAKKFGWKY